MNSPIRFRWRGTDFVVNACFRLLMSPTGEICRQMEFGFEIIFFVLKFRYKLAISVDDNNTPRATFQIHWQWHNSNHTQINDRTFVFTLFEKKIVHNFSESFDSLAHNRKTNNPRTNSFVCPKKKWNGPLDLPSAATWNNDFFRSSFLFAFDPSYLHANLAMHNGLVRDSERKIMIFFCFKFLFQRSVSEKVNELIG